jgi:hypothetical protein
MTPWASLRVMFCVVCGRSPWRMPCSLRALHGYAFVASVVGGVCHSAHPQAVDQRKHEPGQGISAKWHESGHNPGTSSPIMTPTSSTDAAGSTGCPTRRPSRRTRDGSAGPGGVASRRS